MNTLLDELKSAFARAAVDSGSVEPVKPESAVLRVLDVQLKGHQLDVTVAPEAVVAAAELADRFGFAMDTITGVDWIGAGEMEIVYDFFHAQRGLHLVVRTRVQRNNPAVPSIHRIFPGANWHERETHDFFGIEFIGHPNLTPLLLPEDADYHPLRKDFTNAA